MTWKERKAARIAAFWRHRWRVKQVECSACAGSGCYDDDGSPPCGACEGTGKEPERSAPDAFLAHTLMVGALLRLERR